jgi:hypothetical protein
MTTAETWHGIFGAYNTTWLPVLILFWLALIICTYLLITKPSDKTNALMKAPWTCSETRLLSVSPRQDGNGTSHYR